MSIISREIGKKIKELMKRFPAVVLTGARQVGKTTLLKYLFPKFNFISLDLPSVAEQAEQETELFLAENKEPLILDEVQYAPNLFRYLKAQIDADRHKMGRYILTGSQKFILMKGVSDSLAGRAAILNLENLSVTELLPQSTSKKKLDWQKILLRGLYPELWRQPQLGREDFYSSYVATYLERDVRQILNVQSLRDFERFLRACAIRNGQLLNLSDLARDVGIRVQTARDWLSVLEASNQISFLEPYFENIGKRMIKSPKLYINDPGMLCFLLGLEQSTLVKSPLVGSIWESFVFSEFRKQLSFSSTSKTIWYYRDGQGRELDFLLMGGGMLHLYEAKWTEDQNTKWVGNLKDIAGFLSKSQTQKIGSLSLVCRISKPIEKNQVIFKNPLFLLDLSNPN